MIPPNEWKARVLEFLKKLADEDYQRLAWFGMGAEISSPDEMMCQIFDDLMIERFLCSVEMPLKADARDAIKVLVLALEQFSKETPSHLDPNNVIDDEKWKKIRYLARRAADLMSP